VEAHFIVHALSIRVYPSYLEGASFISNFCAEHEPDLTLAGHARAVDGCPAAKRYRRYAERLHLSDAIVVFAF
jgi:hypothetical protein